MCEKTTPPLIRRYEAVEVIIPAGAGGQVAIGDIPNLRTDANQQITIWDIEIMTVNAYGASFLNNAIPGMPIAEVPKAALVLYVKSEESIRWIPLAKLNYTQQEASGVPFQQQRTSFDGLQEVIWPKCYIKFNAATAGTPYIIPLLVTYTKVGISPSGQKY